MASRRLIEPLAQRVLDLVPADVRADLLCEDPAAAIEVHFAPIGVRALPAALIGDACSTDGYYAPIIDDRKPWIFYADDVSARRLRFTLLHELVHHLVATAVPDVYDELDELGGSSAAAVVLEELLCHQVAGSLLVPDELLAPLGSTIRPSDVQSVHERAIVASWDAVAVQVSQRLPNAGAVVLLREEGMIAFCASHGLENNWWGRGSRVAPAGALARAFRTDQIAQSEIYRWNQGYERQLFCDTTRVHDHLVVAVLSTRRSDGGLNILDEIEPSWKTRQTWCEQCNEERTQGWCDRCHDRRCPECGRCACAKTVDNPMCPECGFKSPFRPGARMCRSCERDLGLL